MYDYGGSLPVCLLKLFLFFKILWAGLVAEIRTVFCFPKQKWMQKTCLVAYLQNLFPKMLPENELFLEYG